MLRLATNSDLESIVQMTSACIMAMREQRIDQWDEIYPSASTFQEDIARNHLFVMAEPELAGCICINNVQSPEYSPVDWLYSNEPIWVLHRLMILPVHQGKGYGRRIMKWAEQHAASQGALAIRLDAFVNNPASLKLYDSLGYRRAGEVLFRKGAFVCFEKNLKSR